jgi:biopolymer transport protein ExbD
MLAPEPRRRALAGPQRRRSAIISLTPLIDVVFILLVFFMLASSFLDWRTLALDTAAVGQPVPSVQDTLVVQIDGDELRLNGEVTTLETLIDRARARQPADHPVSLQPLADTRVQAMVRVLDALNAAGVQPLNLLDDANAPEREAR